MDLSSEAQRVFEVPLMRFFGARFEGWADGAAHVALDVDARHLNANDKLHGGTLSTLLDVSAYLAVLPSLESGQTAVTHSMSSSLMGAVSAGECLRVEGRVLRRGRSLAFVQSTATVHDRLVATATVCKTLLVLR